TPTSNPEFIIGHYADNHKREILSMPVNLVAYLFTTVKNRCLNHLRHKMIVQETANQLQEEYIITLRMNLDSLKVFDQNIFNEQDIEKVITQALNTLSPKCKEIFIMSKIEGKKQKQIAEELNISINTVETQIGIAYKKTKGRTEKLFTSIPLSLLFLETVLSNWRNSRLCIGI
ncbi:MAG: sigma-70 family RNA polymerase sigma factor, partial [Parabacteroides sp.]|nr:sigma-70 family RNA polymerase sigma factor [Parabacteroides sp.]